MSRMTLVLAGLIPWTTAIAEQSPRSDVLTLPRGLKESCWLEAIPELGYVDNPCRLSADLDGDQRPDTLQLVEETSGAKRRGIFVRLASGTTARAGAGASIGRAGGDNFDWMDAWKRMARDEHTPRSAKGECVLVEKTEAASGLICWDGKRLRWSQRGD